MTTYYIRIDGRQLEFKLTSVDTRPTVDFVSKGGIDAGRGSPGFRLRIKEHTEYVNVFSFALENLTGEKPLVMPRTSLTGLTDFWFDSALSEAVIPSRLESIIHQKQFADFLRSHRRIMEKLRSGESPLVGYEPLQLDESGLVQIDDSLKIIDSLMVETSTIPNSIDVEGKQEQITALTHSLVERYTKKDLPNPAYSAPERKSLENIKPQRKSRRWWKFW